jgi:hypothetical protein
MKGIIFTEFLAMVEEKFSLDMVDHLIDHSNLASGGAYTSVGTYSHLEMNALVANLSKETGIPMSELLKIFGMYLFKTLSTNYPVFVNTPKNVIEFLSSIETYIHAEVKKLYPDAELPKFKSELLDEKTLELTYSSERHYGDLAEGLIIGSIDFFKNGKLLRREDLPNKSVKFTIQLND